MTAQQIARELVYDADMWCAFVPSDIFWVGGTDEAEIVFGYGTRDDAP